MINRNLTDYEILDEKLSYSELKDRIRAECVRSLPASAIESREPVPIGTYVIIKPDMKLVPVRILVDFDKRNIDILLWEKKLTSN